jgi:hypothetical protein
MEYPGRTWRWRRAWPSGSIHKHSKYTVMPTIRGTEDVHGAGVVIVRLLQHPQTHSAVVQNQGERRVRRRREGRRRWPAGSHGGDVDQQTTSKRDDRSSTSRYLWRQRHNPRQKKKGPRRWTVSGESLFRVARDRAKSTFSVTRDRANYVKEGGFLESLVIMRSYYE